MLVKKENGVRNEPLQRDGGSEGGSKRKYFVKYSAVCTREPGLTWEMHKPWKRLNG